MAQISKEEQQRLQRLRQQQQQQQQQRPQQQRGQRPQQQQQQQREYEKNVLCLYYWRAKEHNWGHVSLKLSDGTYISWWPSGADKRYQGLVPVAIVADWVSPVQDNTLQRDTQDEGYQPDLMQIPKGLDEGKIKQWWITHQRNNGYNGIRLNCSTTVYLALKHGGANSFCLDPGNWYWTPARTLQFASKMKEKMLEPEMKSPGSVAFQGLTAQQQQLLTRQKQAADEKAKKLKNAPVY